MNLEATYQSVKDLKEDEKFAKDMITLIENAVIEKKIVDDVSDYEKVSGVNVRYKEYSFYKHKTENKVAFIYTISSSSKKAIYEIGYDEKELISKLAQLFDKADVKRSNALINTLDILGWIILTIGILISLFLAAEEGGALFFLVGILSSVTASVWFFVGSHILKHLTDINTNTRDLK